MKEVFSNDQPLNCPQPEEELSLPQKLIASVVRKSSILFGLNKAEREDLEQETWVKILTKQARQKIRNLPDRELRYYVQCIARNNAIDFKRRQKLENKYFEPQTDNLEELSAVNQNLLQEVEQFFQAFKIWTTIKTALSHKQKFTILLEDDTSIAYLIRHNVCTFEEIAKELKLPVEVLEKIYIEMDQMSGGHYSNRQTGALFEEYFCEKMTAEQVSNLRHKAYSKLQNCRND